LGDTGIFHAAPLKLYISTCLPHLVILRIYQTTLGDEGAAFSRNFQEDQNLQISITHKRQLFKVRLTDAFVHI